jgi:hypothetical protein
MSAASALLAELRAVGADATVEDDALCIWGAEGALPAELCDRLIDHRADIIALLTEPANDRTHRDISRPVPPVAVADLPVDLMFAFEERAAIAEFDGGLDRAAAERLAWADVIGGGEP